MVKEPDQMEYGDLTEKIIGCAYGIYGEMRFGFLETVYEKCLIFELIALGIKAESQKAITVRHHEEEGSSLPVRDHQKIIQLIL